MTQNTSKPGDGIKRLSDRRRAEIINEAQNDVQADYEAALPPHTIFVSPWPAKKN